MAENTQFAKHVSTAAESLRAALHELNGMDTGDLSPAEWASQVWEMKTVAERLRQLTRRVGERYRSMNTAYDGGVEVDTGAPGNPTAQQIMLDLARAGLLLDAPAKSLDDAFERANRLREKV
jgi:hypothetical protein